MFPEDAGYRLGSFCLREGDTVLKVPDPASVTPERLAAARRHGRVVVAPGSVRALVEGWSLAAAAGVGVWLQRPGVPPPKIMELPPVLAKGETAGETAGEKAATPAGFVVWLASSGTTGAPKWYAHDPQRLLGRLRPTNAGARWLLTYDPGSFAGLQVILTAWCAAATLVARPGADAATLARLATAAAVTHISGTPSFWRTALLVMPPPGPPVQAITLGGEIADAALLARLAVVFPAARLRHIYASTEAGALFAVSDGAAGFPASWLESGIDGVSLRIRNDILEVYSPRRALAGTRTGGQDNHCDNATKLEDTDPWLVTGDRVQRQGDRVLFVGRADGIVNIGGVKVIPEAVEQALLRVTGVADARVWAEPSALTGYVLLAEVVPAARTDPATLGATAGTTAEAEAALRAALRTGLAGLAPAARPRRILLVPEITAVISGKKQRGAPACGT